MKNKLIAKKTTKIRNAFANNISADIKLTKAQIFKRFKSGGLFFSLLGNLGEKALTNVKCYYFSWILSNVTSNAINNLKEN